MSNSSFLIIPTLSVGIMEIIEGKRLIGVGYSFMQVTLRNVGFNFAAT